MTTNIFCNNLRTNVISNEITIIPNVTQELKDIDYLSKINKITVNEILIYKDCIFIKITYFSPSEHDENLLKESQRDTAGLRLTEGDKSVLIPSTYSFIADYGCKDHCLVLHRTNDNLLIKYNMIKSPKYSEGISSSFPYICNLITSAYKDTIVPLIRKTMLPYGVNA